MTTANGRLPAVEIKGSIRYIPANNNNVASLLVIHLNKYYNYVPVAIRFDTDSTQNSGNPINFTIVGHGERPSTYDDALVVRIYTKRLGLQSIPSWVAEGWAYWSLHKLEKALQVQQKVNTSGTEFSSNLVMHVIETTNPTSGRIGELRLVVTDLKLAQPDFFARERITRVVRKSYAEIIDKHLENERNLESQLVIVKESSNRIRMIEYLNDVVQRSGRMPCFAFLYGPIVVSSVSYWMNVLEMLKGRNEMQQYAELTPLAQEAILAVKLVTFAPQWMEYVPDIFYTSDGQQIDTDYFADAMVTLADDCDGLTKAIIMGTLSLMKLSASITLPKELARLAYILSFYVPLATLCGTSSPSASSFSCRKITGAHFTSLFLPVDYTAECVGRGNPMHPLCAMGEIMPQEFRSKLPVLYGEGTGRIEPYGMADRAEEARDLVCPAEMEMYSRTDIYYPRTKDLHFVIWLISGITRYFIDGVHGRRCNVGSFYFSHRVSEGYARGVSFDALIKKQNSVVILPTDIYTDEELLYIQTECTLCPPVASLIPPKNALLPDSDPELDKLDASLRRCHTQRRPPHQQVNLYVRRENLKSKFYMYLREVLMSSTAVVGLSYRTERVLTNLEGRVITVYVNTG